MSVEQAVQRVIDELVGAWNRHDWGCFSRLFAEDADYVSGDCVRLAGRDQIHEMVSSRATAGIESDPVSLVTESIRVLGENAAVALCAWRMGPAGAPAERASNGGGGLLTIVMHRTDEHWRIVSLQNTDSITRIHS